MKVTKLVIFTFVLMFVLSACVTPEPQVITQDVVKPVPVDCTVGEREERPIWDDNHTSIWNAKNPGERIRLLLLGLSQRDRWINYIESFYAGC